MFIDSPELYDAIYHFENYTRECDRLRSLINEVVPGARTILDVACGTGDAIFQSACLILSLSHSSARSR
jgi:ubiquinone/menaquinone biosynthesis C-methylase UbiE